MAIYHLSTKPVSRSSGRTATASIAYRAGIAIKDERTGKEHDYTKRKGVAYTRLHTPNGLKIDRNELWNLAETTETRKNSRTAREIVVNLPHELSGRLRMMLVNDFAKDLANQYDVAVDVAIHTPDAQGDNRNHHAHIMLTTRKLERLESGRVALTDKSQLEMSNTQLKERGLPSAREELKAIREQWANITNKHLKEAKIDARIDHRSHKDRGLEQLPTKKLGWEASALERKGIKTATGDYNRKVEEYNHAMQQLAIIEKSLNAVTEQREQSNDRLREGIERAVKLIENATQNTAWADRKTKLVTQVVGECQRELEGAEREINASASAIDQADRRIAEHQQTKPSTVEALKTELSISEKRKLLTSFHNHIDQQAEKLLKDKLKGIREQAKPQLNEIQELRDNKPLNPFKTKAWQEKLDNKIEQYNKVKNHHDQLKTQGVTKELRRDAIKNYYLERPEAYDAIVNIQEELKQHDHDQQLEQQRSQQQEVRINRRSDKGMER